GRAPYPHDIRPRACASQSSVPYCACRRFIWPAMSHAFTTLRAFAAACLLLVGSTSLAASPSAVTDDEVISSLQDAYLRAVAPGEQADLHRELLATVLQRVKRSHATEVDLAALAAVAMKVMEQQPAGGGDAAEVFKKAINEALR